MSQAHADRNLLLGILAHQNAFITRDALLAAMQSWLYDKAQSLAAILQQQGALDAERRSLLEALVAQHVQLHDGDASKSLQAVSFAGAVRHDLEQMPDPELHASLAYMTQLPPDEDPFRTRVASGTPTSAGTRFRRLRPHAKGGLGEVFVAVDSELNREVALKEIQERHADRPESRARFVLEAEVTGGLEHPGIVPVYGLGTYADGRPFYAMRFIRGDSLMEAIAKYHQQQAVTPRAERPAGSAGLHLRNLLRRLIDVCNAMQYAHDRGVLHRDLKPGNIMLGRYGETLVVDWGLAKASGRPGEPATALTEPPLVPASASGSAATMAGSAIGTPVYMSPEQASGRLDLIGPASDVYSLGATLYCLLTGRPPFKGAAVAVLKQVQAGSFAQPRQIVPDLAPALEAVCLKAMAQRPADRYGAPRDLADDLERWLADEPVHAWPEPWTVKTGRWVRRHKPLVSGATAAALVGLVALTAGLLWYQDEQNRRAGEALLREVEAERSQAEADRKRALAEAGIGQALDQAEQARGELHAVLQRPGGVFGLLNEPKNWQARIQAARASLERARALLDNADAGVDASLPERAAALDGLLRRDEGDRALAVNLEKVRMDMATNVGVQGRFDFKKAVEAYPRVFAAAGITIVNEEPATVAARLRASPIKEQLVAVIDGWAWVAYQRGDLRLPERLMHVARLADPDPAWRDRLRQPKIWRDEDALQDLVLDTRDMKLSPVALSLMANLLRSGSLEQEAWLRLAQAEYPGDFWLNLELGQSLQNGVRYAKQPHEAAGYFRVAVAVRRDSALAYGLLGNALRKQNQLSAAVAAYRKAVELNPQFALAYLSLGSALQDQKHLLAAVAAYRKAIELNPKDALAHTALGHALKVQKQLPEAIAACRTAIELDPKAAEGYAILGSALRDQSQLPEAVAVFRKAIELSPNNPSPRYGLGLTLLSQGLFEESVNAFRSAVPFLRPGASLREPLERQLKRSLALQGLAKRIPAVLDGTEPAAPPELLRMADVCQRYQNRHATAVQLYQQAFKAQPGLASDETKRHRYNAACSAALAGTGHGVDSAKLKEAEKAKRRDQARAWLQADLDGCAKLLKDAKPAALLQIEQRLSHWQTDADLAGVRDAKGLPRPEAKAWHKLWADVAGLLQDARGRFTEAGINGALTGEQKSRVHELKLVAGQTCVLDLDSTAFDTFLKLQDAAGKLLAENDDVSATNLNSRLIFSAPADGIYRIVATSFQEAGVGPYTLRIRVFKDVR